MLENLDDLGHHGNFLYYFLEDIGHFNNFVLGDYDRVSLLLYDLSGCLQHFVNSMDGVDDFFLNFFVKLFLYAHLNHFCVLGVALWSGDYCFPD